jgi:hypothetical protein
VDNIHPEEFIMEEELKLREYDYAKPTKEEKLLKVEYLTQNLTVKYLQVPIIKIKTTIATMTNKKLF